MNTMMGSTLIASTKPTPTDFMPVAAGVCTMVNAGQSPNTNLIPASAKPMKSLATSLAQTKSRVPTFVRSANSAIANWSRNPRPMMRALTARRRSFDSRNAIPSRTAIPTTPINPSPAAGGGTGPATG